MARVELLNARAVVARALRIIGAALDVGLDTDEIRPFRGGGEIRDAVGRHSPRIGSTAWH